MGDVPLETGDVPLTETPQLCGISELLRGDLFDCTTLDLQASRLVNSNSSGSATQHLQRLSQLLGEGGTAATPRLRSLVLNGIHVGDQGAEYLYGALMHPTVLALRMDSCGISKQGAFAVASALNGGAAMRSLSLSWNALGPSGGIAIAVALRRNGSRLSRLYLSHCELGAEGAAALAETVRLGSPLTELVLSQNRLGDTGGLAFAEALSTGPPLQSLDLGYNHLTHRGADALAASLRHNTALHSLWLASNHVADQGARAFGTMLRTNRALRHLGLWNNGIGCGGADALERGLRENTVLTQLTLAHNDLETATEITDKIEEAITRNAEAHKLMGMELSSLERDEL